MNRLSLLLALSVCAVLPVPGLSAEPGPQQVPGVVILHLPASEGKYIGSAGIAVAPDGSYLTKCDEFGPKSTEWTAARSYVFRSTDRGQSWTKVASIDGLFWAGIFTHGDAVYMLGTTKHHGLIVILRSTDSGRTWTTPTDGKTGLLTEQGEYHTAPCPIVIHNGRLWRAMEDASNGTRWGHRYQAMMLSAAVDADLLDARSWTFSNVLPRNPAWLEGKFGGWLEGNAIVAPDGEIVDLLRVDSGARGGQAAIVHISADGRQATFNPEADFIDFPGGSKKFVIRFDPQTKLYWGLSNWVPEKHRQTRAASTRNTLALISSPDLRKWTVRTVLLYRPDVKATGFQYPDWVFEGDDMLAAVRTAHPDGLGGAHNAHDANYLTFHRIRNFRTLTWKDSVVDPASLKEDEVP